MEEKPWAAAVKKIDEMTRAVTTAVLGDDCRVLGAGLVMSRPGSEMQGPFSLSCLSSCHPLWFSAWLVLTCGGPVGHTAVHRSSPHL